MPISDTDLIRFLRIAKQSTYAAQGDETSVPPLLPDSRQLEYGEDEMLYRDIYVGLYRFVGQEIVYASSHAIWSMSYAGGLSPEVEMTHAGRIYAFLRQALRELPADLPLRGPQSMQDDRLHYNCNCTGSLESFSGIETITEQGKCVYQLHFCGGKLQSTLVR